MLIYLDSMIVQYCVDYEEFVFGEISGQSEECPVSELNLRRELIALRQLIFLEQLGNWVYACTPNLFKELHNGKPTDEQCKVYALFSEAWRESGWDDAYPLNSSEVHKVENALKALNLRHSADRQYLAEAIVLKASWFITNDGEMIKKCRHKGRNLPLHVARASECLDEISVGLFLRG